MIDDKLRKSFSSPLFFRHFSKIEMTDNLAIVIFFRSNPNIIDLLTIVPFYLELCLPLFGMETSLNKLTGI